MTLKIQIINGPNLNLLGKREPNIYGNITMDEIKKEVENHCQKKNITTNFYQSNIEGEIVNKIQELSNKYDEKRELALKYGNKYKAQFDKVTIAKNIINIFNLKKNI